MEILKLAIKFIVRIILLIALLWTVLLITTIEKSKAEVETPEVFLVSPQKVQPTDEFKNAIQFPKFPREAVCLSPKEYRRMRASDIVCSTLDTASYNFSLKDEKQESEVWKERAGILLFGIILGYTSSDLINKKISPL